MANAKHLNLIKQGVDTWNSWRIEHEETIPDFSGADLQDLNLNGAYLRNSIFEGANLSNVNFRPGKAQGLAAFWNANIRAGEYFEDSINIALGKTDLRDTNLKYANLSKARLDGAILTGAEFNRTNLEKAVFTGATFGSTLFHNIDLSNVKLNNLVFRSPCFIDIPTLNKTASLFSSSKGQKYGTEFLRGCGLSDWEIEASKLYIPTLSNQEISELLYRVHALRAQRPIQISPLFISYSHADSKFVDKLEQYFNENGIRFWRDIHQATAGRLEKQIDIAIRHNPTLVLILSVNSIKSDWVQHEVRTARKLEIEIERDVLCPIALDDSWKTSKWSQRIQEQIMEYNILDFSQWNDDKIFKQVFSRLMNGLNMFYKE